MAFCINAIHILGCTKQTLEEAKEIIGKSYPNMKFVVHFADKIDGSAVQKAAKEIGSWDVIIANTGYIPTPNRIENSDINIKGGYVLAHAFLLDKKRGTRVVQSAYSSDFAFLPPGIPFLSKSSAYSVSEMGSARFYEFLAPENPDLDVFVLQPGIIRTVLYEKGQLDLEDTLDTVQLPAHFSVWLASPKAKPLSGRFSFAN